MKTKLEKAERREQKKKEKESKKKFWEGLVTAFRFFTGRL